MKKVTVRIYLLLLINLFTCCSEKTLPVEWYVEHPEILKQEVEKCKIKTLDELAKDKHCTVIRVAQQKVFDDHQINAPIPTFKIK